MLPCPAASCATTCVPFFDMRSPILHAITLCPEVKPVSQKAMSAILHAPSGDAAQRIYLLAILPPRVSNLTNRKCVEAIGCLCASLGGVEDQSARWPQTGTRSLKSKREHLACENRVRAVPLGGAPLPSGKKHAFFVYSFFFRCKKSAATAECRRCVQRVRRAVRRR